VVSEAARQLPEEVYKAPKPSATKTGEVIGKAEKKRSRAAHKRGFKNRLEQEVSSASILSRAQLTHSDWTPDNLSRSNEHTLHLKEMFRVVALLLFY
jgi:hypothetical protein